LGFGDGADRLPATLDFDRIEVGRCTRVRGGMDPNTAFELIVRSFIECWNKIELRIFCIGQIDIILNEWHHSWKTDHRMWVTALFQDLDI
jgi:hypothetical protein